jgi:hypothetical protein
LVAPIYTYEFILSTAGIVLEDNPERTGPKNSRKPNLCEAFRNRDSPEQAPTSERTLRRAIDEEAYERASRIRDELNKRKNS